MPTTLRAIAACRRRRSDLPARSTASNARAGGRHAAHHALQPAADVMTRASAHRGGGDGRVAGGRRPRRRTATGRAGRRRLRLSNLTRVETWRFFEPPLPEVDPDYTFFGNRSDLDLERAQHPRRPRRRIFVRPRPAPADRGDWPWWTRAPARSTSPRPACPTATRCSSPV